jgi:hypothetical protein
MKIKFATLAVFVAFYSIFLSGGCSNNSTQISELQKKNVELEKQVKDLGEKGFKPGLGEIMSLTQMRHAKLFFAGDQQNWELADYELEELVEGFDDAVAFHPTHKTLPKPTTELLSLYMNEPLEQIRKAVKDNNKAEFSKSYQALTTGCNGCHVASNFGFNVVKQPTTPPYSNQDFQPPIKK